MPATSRPRPSARKSSSEGRPSREPSLAARAAASTTTAPNSNIASRLIITPGRILGGTVDGPGRIPRGSDTRVRGVLSCRHAPTDPRRGVLLAAAVALTLILLAAALALLPRAAAPDPGPTTEDAAAEVALAYLRALEAGDVTAAYALVEGGAPSGPLLTDGVYARAQDRPARPVVESSQAVGDVVQVRVGYAVGGEDRVDTLRVGTAGADRWLREGLTLQQLRVGSAAPLSEPRDVLVNGVGVGRLDGTLTFSALPGSYAVEVAATPRLAAQRGTVGTFAPSLTVREEPAP